MQPLIFLQQGDKAWIKRVGGAEETKRFLFGAVKYMVFIKKTL